MSAFNPELIEQLPSLLRGLIPEGRSMTVSERFGAQMIANEAADQLEKAWIEISEDHDVDNRQGETW